MCCGGRASGVHSNAEHWNERGSRLFRGAEHSFEGARSTSIRSGSSFGRARHSSIRAMSYSIGARRYSIGARRYSIRAMSYSIGARHSFIRATSCKCRLASWNLRNWADYFLESFLKSSVYPLSDLFHSWGHSEYRYLCLRWVYLQNSRFYHGHSRNPRRTPRRRSQENSG